MKVMLKKTSLSLLLIALISIQQLSAQTLKAFFNSPEVPVTFLGVDFTQAKLYNDAGANVQLIQSRYYPQINQLIIDEQKKRYDIPDAFNKTAVTNDISLALDKNSKIDPEKILEVKQEQERLKKANIERIVKGYDFSGKKGLGMIIIMENMNKLSKDASMFFTIVDMGSKKVLFAEKVRGEASGIGFRNYWAKTISNAIIDIKKSKYKEWKASAS